MNIKKAIEKVACSSSLTEKEAYLVFKDIMSGKACASQIGAFITALRMKGETVDEITGAARVMREKARKIKTGGRSIDIDRDEAGGAAVLDTCGTGGTGAGTFNISTTVAFVLAGCGVKVAKHGNRAASSRCGSADVLEALGVNVEVPVKVTEKCISRINIGFMYAPLFHGAMKYAAPVRRELGIRTIFNILGPLSNPAAASCQVLGVYDEKLTVPIAKVLKKLGIRRAYVVHGKDGLDEVTITDRTLVAELAAGRIMTYTVSPADFGVKKAPARSIKGGSVRKNARIVREILRGSKGPRRDIVLVNSSLALMAAGKAKSFKEGMKLASRSIDSGKALEKLKDLARMTSPARKRRN